MKNENKWWETALAFGIIAAIGILSVVTVGFGYLWLIKTFVAPIIQN